MQRWRRHHWCGGRAPWGGLCSAPQRLPPPAEL